jgi:hypothetical protein
MFITHDDRNCDPAYGAIVTESQTELKSLDYVYVRQKDTRTWLAQVVQPNLFLPMMGADSLSPTLVHGLKLSQTHKNVRSVANIYWFKLLYLGEITDGNIRDTGSRPAPGSEGLIPDIEELCGYLNIPAFNDSESKPNAIGTIVNLNNYSLCLNPDIFRMHVGVFGSNGSGKTNTGANLIYQATYNDMCALVHDVKPDYYRMREPNADPRVEHLWTSLARFHLSPRGIPQAHVIGFYGMCDIEAVDTIIGLHASDFTGEELAGLLFHNRNENLQYEAFADVFMTVKQGRGDGATFSLADVLTVVSGLKPDQINQSTKGAILQKAPKRKPVWLDAIGRMIGAGSTMKRVEPFNIGSLAAAGKVILISYDAAVSDKDYAIVVSYFLRTTQNMCAKGRFPSGCKGMVQFIDEAHRLFDNESLHQNMLINRFNRVMREGRSKDHSVCMMIQNVDRIPIGVMNNINTRIVMKQNNKKMADLATDNFPGEGFETQALHLGTGQALVKFAESNFVLKAHMAPSPFELLRSDNRAASRKDEWL